MTDAQLSELTGQLGEGARLAVAVLEVTRAESRSPSSRGQRLLFQARVRHTAAGPSPADINVLQYYQQAEPPQPGSTIIAALEGTMIEGTSHFELRHFIDAGDDAEASAGELAEQLRGAADADPFRPFDP